MSFIKFFGSKEMVERLFVPSILNVETLYLSYPKPYSSPCIVLEVTKVPFQILSRKMIRNIFLMYNALFSDNKCLI